MQWNNDLISGIIYSSIAHATKIINGILRQTAAPPQPHLRTSKQTQQTNMHSQQLYLDLVRHPRKIKFKVIKNIYKTLTEGKADEVIYKKDKS